MFRAIQCGSPPQRRGADGRGGERERDSAYHQVPPVTTSTTQILRRLQVHLVDPTTVQGRDKL